MPQADYPRYPLPLPVLLDLALAVITRRQRSFRRHAQQMAKAVTPPLRVICEVPIPLSGPGVILVNHYARPGFWMPWLPAAICSVVPSEVTWVMTSALTFPGSPLRRFLRPASQQVLSRVAEVYGFLSMPPMPPIPGEISDRASAVQRLVAFIRAHPSTLLGLAPEGGDQPGGILTLPPSGAGRLALLLARSGMEFYPVGAYEEAGRFVLCFGAPFSLRAPEAGSREELDLQVRVQMMRAVAGCLPARLRGEFAG